MNASNSVPAIFTSMPPSFTSITSQVTTWPLRTSPGAPGSSGVADAGFGAKAVGAELLDAERDALLLDVDVEHLRLDDVALLVVLHRLLAGLRPVEVGEVDHAVDVAVEADEQTELGLVLDLALDLGADRVLLGEGLPRVLTASA